MIQTGEGLKPIEKIRKGDLVLSRDEETGEISRQRVTRTFVHRYDGGLVTLTVGKESTKVTSNHPIWVEAKGWTPAGELTLSDQVVLADGKPTPLESITVAPTRGPPILVYNLEVEETHTYFVGKQGVWVHNKYPEPPPTQWGSWEDFQEYITGSDTAPRLPTTDGKIAQPDSFVGNPPVIVDPKFYDFGNGFYDQPFGQEKVIEELLGEYKNWQNIDPVPPDETWFWFPNKPPQGIIDGIEGFGGKVGWVNP